MAEQRESDVTQEGLLGHRTGFSGGHEHPDRSTAHLLSQHFTGVSFEHGVLQASEVSAQVPLSHLKGRLAGHGHLIVESTHVPSWHRVLGHTPVHTAALVEQNPSAQRTGALGGHGQSRNDAVQDPSPHRTCSEVHTTVHSTADFAHILFAQRVGRSGGQEQAVESAAHVMSQQRAGVEASHILHALRSLTHTDTNAPVHSLWSPIAHGHSVSDVTHVWLKHRIGVVGEHGHAFWQLPSQHFHSPVLHAADAAAHVASALMQIRCPIEVLHGTGESRGHGHPSGVAAHVMSRHCTGVGLAHRTWHALLVAVHFPLSQRIGVEGLHGHIWMALTQLPSQHVAWSPLHVSLHAASDVTQSPLEHFMGLLGGHGHLVGEF